jgi:hypothetical protein
MTPETPETRKEEALIEELTMEVGIEQRISLLTILR